MKTNLSNTSNLKKMNVDRIKSELRNGQDITKNKLASSTGLSVATCGNILKELIMTKEVFEIEHAKSTGGRPAKKYRFNKDFSHILTLYPSRLNTQLTLSYRITDLIGNTVDEAISYHDQIDLETLTKIIDGLIDDDNLIKVVGIGLPGVVIKGKVDTCDIDSFENISIGDSLSERYKLPVIVENDVNSTVIGFYNRLQNNKSESVVYIYYPADDCLGSGIIINGKLHYGMSNFAGEVGDLPYSEVTNNHNFHHMPPRDFADSVAKTLMTFTCTINPDNIVLSGASFTESVKTLTQEQFNLLCKKEHQPKIHYEKDMTDNYFYGLTTLALERLTVNLEITNKY